MTIARHALVNRLTRFVAGMRYALSVHEWNDNQQWYALPVYENLDFSMSLIDLYCQHRGE